MLSVKYYRDKMTLLVKMDMKYEIIYEWDRENNSINFFYIELPKTSF